MIYLRSQRNHKFKKPCGAVNSLLLTLIAILSVDIMVGRVYSESEGCQRKGIYNIIKAAAIFHIVNIHVQSMWVPKSN